MSSRDGILKKVKEAQPSLVPLPPLPHSNEVEGDVERFQAILESIGGQVIAIEKEEHITGKIVALFPGAKRVVSSTLLVGQYFLKDHRSLKQQSFKDVEICIIEAQFGVAENGAVWVTEEDMKVRVLPFICEHLVVLLSAKDIVPTMKEAYMRIGMKDYSFGVFIAGPSKTADIEQSLVLGAHGPKGLTVILHRRVE